MNYDVFISKLRDQSSTDLVLNNLFSYFRDNVSYNYDELQVVKYQRYENGGLKSISDFIQQNKDERSESFKNYLIKLLDVAFLEIEGRPLSERYGKVIHHEAQPAKNGIIKIKAREAYDEVVHIEPSNYPPVYDHGLLKDGVCAEYAKWVKQICDEIGIKCFVVKGRGSTGHRWNLIYIKERDEWVNFDMTMVRFYLDGWTREYGVPESWVSASFEDMFHMQPERVIEEISNGDTVIYNSRITKDNYQELVGFLNGESKITNIH